MWIQRPRHELPTAYNLENGHFLGVRSSDDTRGVRTWEIVSTIPVPGVQAQTIMDGYTSYDDAVAAFDTLLSSLDINLVVLDDPTAIDEGSK